MDRQYQARLGTIAPQPSEENDSKDSDISEIEDTEKKVEAMFSKVSDDTDNLQSLSFYQLLID